MRSLIPALALALVVSGCSDGDTLPTGAASTSAPATGSSPSSTAATTTTTTVGVPGVPLDAVDITAELVIDGLDSPIFLTARPGDERLFVVEQGGIVLAVDPATGASTVFLDLSDRTTARGEQGLLGIAFVPDDGSRLIVHYTALSGDTVVSEFTVDTPAGPADPSSERIVFTTPQPAPNHNGGMIAFGPDGYLYVGLGDGGRANDVFGNGQDPATPLGAILRIDLDGDPYAIPADNPFADGGNGAPEVWAWGLRNPWRFSFDGDALWVGDVGQETLEEIDRFVVGSGGENAGWPVLEGTRCFRVADCDPAGFLAPVHEYLHDEGRCSVTGGVVYRGDAIPDLQGVYLFGDYCTGEVWGFRIDDPSAVRLFTAEPELPARPGLGSFGVGPDGEVYLVLMFDGVYRLSAGRQVGS